MDLPLSDYRKMAVGEFDTSKLLAHAAQTGRPRGAHDLIIAATALAHGRTVVTLDRRGFEGLPGVQVRGAQR